MNIGYNKGKKYNVLKDTTQQLILKGIVAEAIEVKSTSKNNKLPYGYLSTGCPPPPSECDKGGRPVGSTHANKQNFDLTTTATLNAVTQSV